MWFDPLKQIEDRKAIKDVGVIFLHIWMGAFDEALELGKDNPEYYAQQVTTCYVAGMCKDMRAMKDEEGDNGGQ